MASGSREKASKLAIAGREALEAANYAESIKLLGQAIYLLPTEHAGPLYGQSRASKTRTCTLSLINCIAYITVIAVPLCFADAETIVLIAIHTILKLVTLLKGFVILRDISAHISIPASGDLTVI